MRWVTLALILMLSGLSVQAIDFAEGENHPDFINEDVFDSPEDFIDNYLDDDWSLITNTETSFERFLSWAWEDVAVVTLIEMTFDDSASRNEFLRRDDIFDFILSNYQPATVTDNCRLNDVVLFEAEGIFDDEPYITRHYFWSDTPTTLWRVDYIFPESEENVLQTYLEDFQPDLMSCEE